MGKDSRAWEPGDIPLQRVSAVSKYVFHVRKATELWEGHAKAISQKACPDSVVLCDQL